MPEWHRKIPFRPARVASLGGVEVAEPKQKRAAAFKSAPPPRDVKKRQDESKPVNPDELKKYAERDTRKTRLQARARALLITEIQGLERLYKNTPEQSADKPQLTRRLTRRAFGAVIKDQLHAALPYGAALEGLAAAHYWPREFKGAQLPS